MSERLTWQEIEKRYDQEWVELVDYDWPDGTPDPRSGVIRTHHSSKKEFHRLCREGDVPSDSALVFVGRKRHLESLALVPSLIKIQPCVR